MEEPPLYCVTPYYMQHLALGAEMFFKGTWARPKVFLTAPAEALATRRSLGLIDAHSMGKITILGKDSRRLLQYAMANNLEKAKLGKGAIYSCLCEEDGTIVDDVIVYALSEIETFLISNTVSGPKVEQWLQQLCREHNFDAFVLNDTGKLGYIALQGPSSAQLLDKIFPVEFRKLQYFEFAYWNWEGIKMMLARTGYTGELGYELLFPSQFGHAIWERLLDLGKEFDIQPVGARAVQLLRLEKSYRAYGMDMTGEHNPYEAGLGWSVSLDAGDFCGRKALEAIRAEGVVRKIMGYKLSGPVRAFGEQRSLRNTAGEVVGRLSSVCDSPTLGYSIGMGMLEQSGWDAAELRIGNSTVLASCTKMPFFDPKGERIKAVLL